ncbi:MAG: four helix bundle protein [Candidatus Omnitrophica bacterium]|nr:four helix bundle protein [Candidatus Omnitrophota bacterium]
MKIQSYKDLDVWKKGLEIVDKVYNLTKKFPDTERYGLVVQMQRAAVSIPSNIAEGFRRYHKKEYIQFLYIAQGSCGELETQLIISQKRDYITQKELEGIQENLDHECRMLSNLIKGLRA